MSTLLGLVVEELEGFERDLKGIPPNMVLPKGSTMLGKKGGLSAVCVRRS